MARPNIPGVVDILRVNDPQLIETIADDDALDRDYKPTGPGLNRFLVKRIRQVFALDGKPLPAVCKRDDAARAKAQTALDKRLTALARKLVPEDDTLEPLAAYVRGAGNADRAGPLAQDAVGSLFDPDFKATPELWQMAELFAAAPRCLNPVKLLRWAITGEVKKARRTLSEAVNHDPAALHGIGIAVHNMERGFRQMRALWKDPAERANLSVRAAVARCLFAPSAVLRQPVRPGRAGTEDFTANTLIVMELDAARTRRPDRTIIFMTGRWSQCPAHAWVPALYEAVWRRACSEESDAQ